MSDSTIQTLIAIDAGGSKTVARLLNLGTNTTVESATGAGSLTNDTKHACITILNLIKYLLTDQKADAQQTMVIIGAAGAENDNNIVQLRQALSALDLAELIIKTDAYISLYGATNGQPGVVVALGTGSVALRLDQNNVITQFGGWGFRVGDQGSGAHLGRELVISVLKELDKGNVDSHLVRKTLETIGSDRQAILGWVKSATARDFASLCPLIVSEQNTDTLAKHLINQTLADIEELILLARGNSQLPVYIMGGLGNAIIDYLPLAKEDWVKLAFTNAVDGALLLGRHYLEQRH